jgi:nucleoside triphosphate diphosphatase
MVVSFLREHCAWDRAQTAESLVPHLLEEAHETADAVQVGDAALLRSELGDLLLNVAFQVVVAEESGRFDREDVIAGLEAKMIRRHPHIFGPDAGGDRPDWEAVKAAERRASRAGTADEGTVDSVLDSLPRGLDPLLRAHRMQEKAAGVGFDWDNLGGVIRKVREELGEVEEALAAGSASAVQEEIGDLLFSVVNLARMAEVHSVPALAQANAKFRRRFMLLEQLAQERGLPLPGASLEELDGLWEEAKARIAQGRGDPTRD